MRKTNLLNTVAIHLNKKHDRRYKYHRQPIVQGVGINDYEGFIKVNGKVLPSYVLWNSILNRCYNPKHHAKHPAYIDCSICDEWKHFSAFNKWFGENHVDGYQIDKDILVKGNKVYSPDTCCFVPREINNVIENARTRRGNTPMGVFERCGNYLSYVRVNGKRKYLGTFPTIEQAFGAMKEKKEQYIKEVAQRYFDEGKIARNVYEALMNYKVEITD